MRKTAMTIPHLRLAPTPSGFLHIGNGVNFVANWPLARAQPGGRLLLRIDDLDAERKRPEYVQDIFETLDWLGLDWDEGPRSPDDFEQNWSQHLRLPLYETLLQGLREKGLVYACAKSRRELAAIQGDFPAHIRAQGLSLDTPGLAWRAMTPAGFPLPDFVVRKKDGLPAYQIASLADDLHFGITHLIRGDDLRDSTKAQHWLAAQLGLHPFERVWCWHHALLKNADGEKLSKSAGATALRTARAAGLGPALVYAATAKVLGLTGERFDSLRELQESFNT